MRESFDGKEQVTQEQEGNRNNLIAHLRVGAPVYLLPQEANGDSLIDVWAHYQVFAHVCENNNIPVSNLHIELFANSSEKDSKGFDANEVEDRFHLGKPIQLPYNFHQRRYTFTAETYGLLPVHKNDFNYPPRLLPMSMGPLQSFNEALVQDEGEKIRSADNTQGKKRITIAQFGHTMAKRFTDKQVEQIARSIKKRDTGCIVSVVSDKPFLKKEINEKLKYKEVLLKRFPIDDEAFQQEISTLAAASYGNSVDSVISGDSNTICPIFYASDNIIATDSYGAWLATGAKIMQPERNGSLRANDIICFYNVSDTQAWGIPGATHVESSIVTDLRQKKSFNHRGFISPDDYYIQRFKQEPSVPDIFFSDGYSLPIGQQDIDKLIVQIQKDLFT